MDSSEVAKQKEVEHYSASVSAWFNSALEHDKSLLTLSAGGIGLLVTLLTTVGVSSSEGLILYSLAIAFFVSTIGCVLFVFKRNKTHIENVIAGSSVDSDRVLTRLDTAAATGFGLGVVFSALIGIAAAANSFTDRSVEMSNKERINILESFNNLARLQQTPTDTRSFDGAARLRPAQPATEQPAAPVVQPAAPAPGVPAAGESSKGE
jgi:hypothetical protein